MKVTRIVNRGRIAPSTPPRIIDSGRNSWSTASIVSSIETKSPEPKLAEQVTEKLEQSIATSAAKKKLIIIVSIAAAITIIVGIICAIVLPITLTTITTITTSTTETPSTVTDTMPHK